MQEFLDTLRANGVFQARFIVKSRLIDAKPEPEWNERVGLLLGVAQSGLLATAANLAEEIALDPYLRPIGFERPVVETVWRQVAELGDYSELGYVEINGPFGPVRLRFDAAEFNEGSLLAEIRAAVLGAILSAGVAVGGSHLDRTYETLQYQSDLQYSRCATDVRVDFSPSDFAAAAIHGIPDIRIPNDPASERESRKEVCVLQAFLKRHSEWRDAEGRDLMVDGIFGPNTLASLKAYASHVGDDAPLEVVLRRLVQEERQDRQLLLALNRLVYGR